MANNSVEYLLSLKDKFSSGIQNATVTTEKLNSEMGIAQKSALGLGSAIASIGAGLIAREIVNVTAAMEGLKNQLNFASGSAIQGGRDFEYLRETSEKMGLDFNTAATAFAKFSGAAAGIAVVAAGARSRRFPVARTPGTGARVTWRKCLPVAERRHRARGDAERGGCRCAVPAG